MNKMKASKFNISTKDPSAQRLLFNTMYGTTSIIESDEIECVSQILKSPNRDFEDPISVDLKDKLIAGKYLIDDSVDEIAILQRRKSLGMEDPNRFDLIVMPNLDCNFACPYCYEAHCHSNQMSDDVEARLVKWIAGNISRYKVMLLSWFGGEPTLSPGKVVSISKRVGSLAEESGVQLLSHMTTNGYALTKQIAIKFIEAGIYSYQITVDGPQHIHDQTRLHVNGKGSYRQIYRNIVCLAECDPRVKISLRVNYNHKNLHFIPELLNAFPTHIRPQLRVVYEPIFGDAALSATKNMSHSEISKKVTEYYNYAESIGYDISLGTIGVGKLVYCYAERTNQYIVNYNGDVFKCSVTDFDPSSRVGRIDENGTFVAENGWIDWFGMDLFEDKCMSCGFLPICMGGCRKDRSEKGATGSYCNLVPSNTSHALKTVAFGTFSQYLRETTKNHQRETTQQDSIIARSNT